MKRREFLQAAAIVAVGATVLPSGWVLSAEQKVFLAAQPNFIDQKPLTFFNEDQRAMVTAVVDHIIPATDTPGGLDAGTPRFVELMVSDWFNDAERALFMDGLADLGRRSVEPFAELSAQRQLELLEEVEGESADSDWYSMGNIMRVWDSQAPFICQFKELTVLGFCMSEVGATTFLRENPMGSFDGEMALQPDDSSYAAAIPLRMMGGDNI